MGARVRRRDGGRRARRGAAAPRQGFAGSGRVGPITVSPGRIAATVNDPDGIFEVTVHLTTLTDVEWERFLDQVGAEAGHLAALLDGEVPRSLVHAADAAGVALLPTIGDMESDCDCPDIGDPCQHAAALCYQTAWLLDDNPFVLLLLRGQGSDELLDALGAREQVTATGGADRPVPATTAYAADPLPLPASPPAPARRDGPTIPPAPDRPPDALDEPVAAAAARARTLLAEG